MGTEFYPPNPTHENFYEKLFKFRGNYDEVEEKGFISSEELEKLEAQVKEVQKAKNVFENATVDCCHIKYADVYLCTVQTGFMLDKLRKIHNGSDFTELDIQIKELSSLLIDWFREVFVKKGGKSSPRNSGFVGKLKDQARLEEKVDIDPRFKLPEETKENLENASDNFPPENVADKDPYTNYQEWSQENYYWFYDVEDEEALGDDDKAAVDERNETDVGQDQDVTDAAASDGVDDAPIAIGGVEAVKEVTKDLCLQAVANTEVDECATDSNDSVLNVKTKEDAITVQFPFDPGAAKITSENEESTMDEDEENAKKNVKEAFQVPPFIFNQGEHCGTFILHLPNDPDAGSMFKESKMSGHFPYDPGTCDDAQWKNPKVFLRNRSSL